MSWNLYRHLGLNYSMKIEYEYMPLFISTIKENTMKKLTIFLFIMLFCVILSAQSEVWLWANGAGGTSSDRGRAIANDALGNCYVTGSFVGTVTFGTSSLTSSGSDDIFIAKLDSYGNWLWSKSAGGNSTDIAYGISIDADGACYVTGSFMGDATFGVTNISSSGSTDIFVAKLDSDGDWLWAIRAGGVGSDTGNAISTDVNGNCFITGSFSETASFGSSNLTSAGGVDILISKIGTNGNWLWAKRAGGTGADTGYGIATDATGNCCQTGLFSGIADFGSTFLTSAGANDIFSTKLDTDGNWL